MSEKRRPGTGSSPKTAGSQSVNDDQVKLTRLLQYMTGDAAIALRSCALIGGSSGYAQAREVLKSRFGSSHLVAQRVINDLKNGKTVSSAAEVRKLADDLTTKLVPLELA